jgi:positive regulator of sigma E activity
VSVPTGGSGVRPGDQLRLSVPARAVLQAAVLAYGIPLLTLLAGAVLLGFGESDLHALAGAILGLAVGMPLGRRLQQGIFGRLMLAADAGTAA